MKRVSLLVALFVSLLAAPAVAAGPSPGAPGIGDPLFPGLGNGGYDVQHYDVAVRYGAAFTDPVEGNVTILARATQALSRLNLDFAGRSVGAVVVNGAPAQWRREGSELVITPRRAIKHGALFVVTVAKFVAVPTVPSDDPASTGLFIHPSGTATAPQPDLARYFLPSNDHPRDKASFDFRFDVPEGRTAVANGVPLAKWTSRGRTHSVFVQRQPMATELIQMAVGDYDVTYDGFHDGVFRRDVTARPLTAEYLPLLEPTDSQLDWMRARAGRYPFDLYGALVVDGGLGFALETQTLSLMDKFWYADLGKDTWDATLLHELAHEWYGNSVSPYAWSDLWLNEGHASWYEFTWAEEFDALEEDTTGYPDEQGYATVVELMKAVYAHGDEWRAESGPVAAPSSADELFAFQRYHGGALVLYALRQKVGADAFARIERAYPERFRNRSVTTDDFIALAAEISGRRDVIPFLREWLYGTKTPPMPGHPDWTVNDPATQRTATLPNPRAHK
ncbi:M1 family metallopeptidase [Solirubrobacter sp. CPCC 204708]|uniref:Aminopeptidase N n=1 Tax=Solirubrobacter deserti TaxID=2282478 RepID=A0ABT4RLB6_9ACTN|nr:M1 family metallopeptidase [Solirubrobacter deserti]MBE2319054.1 M1 family metallopeptidase [Solirubrobacter deserti]MDA0139131.1 M1 family metallopeptidase [Solirubrobacter deserti]